MADSNSMEMASHAPPGAAVRKAALPRAVHPRLGRPVAGFSGRQQDLVALDRILASAGQLPAVVTGPAGIGKSALAEQYCWLNSARFAGIWWLRARSRDTLIADLLDIGGTLLSDLAQEPDAGKAAARVLALLAKPGEPGPAPAGDRSGGTRHRPWLLVYDDVEQLEEIEALLPQSCAQAAGAQVIVTTRAASWEGPAGTITLAALPPEAALVSLMGEAPLSEATDAAHVAGVLGQHPLALTLARATKHARGGDWAAYRADLEPLLAPATDAKENPAALGAAFALAMQLAESRCPDATRLMGLLSFWAPDEIPLALVSSEVMSGTELAAAAAALSDVGLLRLWPASGGTTSVSLPRAAQELMQAKLAEVGERDAGASLALDLLAGALKKAAAGSAPGNASENDLIPHIRAAAATAPASGDGAAVAARLLESAAIHHAERGLLEPAQACLRQRLAVLEASGGDTAALDETRRNLELVKAKIAEAARLAPPRPPRRLAAARKVAASGTDGAGTSDPSPEAGEPIPPPPLIGTVPPVATTGRTEGSGEPQRRAGFLSRLFGRG